MDRTANQDDITRALLNFDRMKKQQLDNIEADAAAASVSAIGTNTPMTLLVDVRQAITEQTKVLMRTQEIMLQQIEESKRMHSESIAYMQELSELLRRAPTVTPTYQLPIRGGSNTPTHASDVAAPVYYHQSDIVNDGPKVMACLLIQLERISSRNMGVTPGMALDTVAMELKDWVSVIKSIAKADSRVTERSGSLTLPKISSTEAQYVLNIVTSPTKGRTIMCKAEHFSDIATNCPAMTGCMEEIRIRILRCPGVIGMQRARSLASIPFPYVDDNGDLIRAEPSKKEIGSMVVTDKVMKLNVIQREVYIISILRDGERPMVAAERATGYSTKRAAM